MENGYIKFQKTEGIKMEIRFAHDYIKIPRDYKRSKLLDAIPVMLQDLSKEFIAFDTRYFKDGNIAYFPLPPEGEYVLLILQAGFGHGQLWTTLRSRIDRDENDRLPLYKKNIGEIVKCVIKEESG